MRVICPHTGKVRGFETAESLHRHIENIRPREVKNWPKKRLKNLFWCHISGEKEPYLKPVKREAYPNAAYRAREVHLWEKCTKCKSVFRIKNSVRFWHVRNPDAENPEISFNWVRESDYDLPICPKCNSDWQYLTNLNL